MIVQSIQCINRTPNSQLPTPKIRFDALCWNTSGGWELEVGSCRVSREVFLQGVEGRQYHDPHDDDADVIGTGGAHSDRLRACSARSASTIAWRFAASQARSASRAWRDASTALAVSSGAGPPWVLRTSTKCRALMICAICASEYCSGTPSKSPETAVSVAPSGASGRSRCALTRRAAIVCAAAKGIAWVRTR